MSRWRRWASAAVLATCMASMGCCYAANGTAPHTQHWVVRFSAPATAQAVHKAAAAAAERGAGGPDTAASAAAAAEAQHQVFRAAAQHWGIEVEVRSLCTRCFSVCGRLWHPWHVPLRQDQLRGCYCSPDVAYQEHHAFKLLANALVVSLPQGANATLLGALRGVPGVSWVGRSRHYRRPPAVQHATGPELLATRGAFIGIRWLRDSCCFDVILCSPVYGDRSRISIAGLPKILIGMPESARSGVDAAPGRCCLRSHDRRTDGQSAAEGDGQGHQGNPLPHHAAHTACLSCLGLGTTARNSAAFRQHHEGPNAADTCEGARRCAKVRLC